MYGIAVWYVVVRTLLVSKVECYRGGGCLIEIDRSIMSGDIACILY